jgi:hypothetical protein
MIKFKIYSIRVKLESILFIIYNSVIELLTKFRYKFNWLTRKYRVLPNTLIIGVIRGGTTSLFDYLSQHSSISTSFTKETRFFDANYDKGLTYYQSSFPLKFFKKKIILEATPSYIFHPLAPKRIYESLGNIKAILLLRNPIDRCISNFDHEVAKKREPLDLYEALRTEEVRIAGEIERICRNEVNESYSLNHFSYLTKSLYSKQIQNWLNYHKRENLLVLESEDLFNDPQNTCNIIFDFLGIQKETLKRVEQLNKSDNSLKTTISNFELIKSCKEDTILTEKILQCKFKWFND